MGLFGHLESMTTENRLKEAGLHAPRREGGVFHYMKSSAEGKEI